MLADVHQPQFNIWAWQKAHLNPVFDITRVLAEVKDRLTSFASIRITMVAAIWDRSMCLFLLMQLKLLSPVFVVSVSRNHNPVSLAIALDMTNCTQILCESGSMCLSLLIQLKQYPWSFDAPMCRKCFQLSSTFYINSCRGAGQALLVALTLIVNLETRVDF